VPEHKAGHGSLIRAHMQTPVWSSHPIPPAPLRTVDLFPAMLGWLGITPPLEIDGEAVWTPQLGAIDRPLDRVSESRQDALPATI
jgi:hypothetical protein